MAIEELRTVFCHPHLQDREGVSARRLLLHLHFPNSNHQELMNERQLYWEYRESTEIVLKHLQSTVDSTGFSDFIAARIESFDAKSLNLFEIYRDFLFQQFFFGVFMRYPSEKDRVLQEAVANFHLCFKGTDVVRKGLRMAALARVSEAIFEGVHPSLLPERTRWEGREDEWSEHLLGVFFFTGIIQLTELFTHTTLAWVRNQEQIKYYQGLIERLDIVRACVYETLRIYPLLLTTSRVATQDCKISGSTLTKGTEIFVNFQAIQRSSPVDSGQFSLQRWLNVRNQPLGLYLPFGLGPRSCPASAFAIDKAIDLISRGLEGVEYYIDSDLVHSRRLPRGASVGINVRHLDRTFHYPLRKDKRTDIADSNIWGGATACFRSILSAFAKSRRFDLDLFCALISNLRAYGLNDPLMRQERSDVR